jgi:hypothetical protein
VKIICFLSVFTRYFDGILIKYNKTFSQLSLFKFYLYKKIYYKIRKKNNCILSDIIISVAVMKSRLENFKYTLNSLLSQNYKASKIIVNYDKTISPRTIKSFAKYYQKRNVEFRLVENYGSHKKYLFLTSKERKKKILLCDDDWIYDKWFIEHLKKTSDTFRDCVVTLFGLKMSLTSSGKLLERKNWNYMLSCCKKSNKFFFTGNAWTLYPKNFFNDKNITKKKKISTNLKNPQTNVIGYDDSWLNFHRIRKNIKVVYARPYSLFFKPAGIFYSKNIFSLGKSCNGRWHEAKVFDRIIKKFYFTKLNF